MGAVYRRAQELPWEAHPEAAGLRMKELLKLSGEGITVSLHRLPPAGIPQHAPPRRHIIWVLSGRGRLWAQDLGEVELEPGAFIYVPSGVPHRFYDLEGGMEIFTVSLPPEREVDSHVSIL